MAPPTIQKTWNFTVNQSVGNSGTLADDLKEVLLSFKNDFFLNGNWTVLNSSDGTAANASDLWVNIGDLVFDTTGNAHSWIEMRNAELNMDLVIDCNAATADKITIKIAMPTASPMTPGTLTTSPSYLYQTTVLTNTTKFTGQTIGGASTTFTTHSSISDDFENQRFVVYDKATSMPMFELFLETMKNPKTALLYPVVVGCFSSTDGTSSCKVSNDLLQEANSIYVGNNTSIVLSKTGYIAAEGYVGAPVGTDNSFTSDLQLSSMLIMKDNYMLGELYDLWIQESSGVNEGDTYNPSKAYVSMSAFVRPWDGSTPDI
jgi:hypothetical protein